MNKRSKGTKSTEYRKLRQELKMKTEEVKKCEADLSAYSSTTVNIERFSAYLKVRYDVTATLYKYYQSSIFRKLRFRCYLYKNRADDCLVKKIKDKFGPKLALIIGNWTARASLMARYHEPNPEHWTATHVKEEMFSSLLDRQIQNV